MATLSESTFWKRFLTALVAAAVLVFACSLSMQPHAITQPEGLLLVAAGVLLWSVPAAAISAFLFRRSELFLVLGAQVITVVGIATFFSFQH